MAAEMDRLPDWYPLANATAGEIEMWLKADVPPYDAMREALPWLSDKYQFNEWIAGLREARRRYGDRLADAVPTAALIPLPPRRLAGRTPA